MEHLKQSIALLSQPDDRPLRFANRIAAGQDARLLETTAAVDPHVHLELGGINKSLWTVGTPVGPFSTVHTQMTCQDLFAGKEHLTLRAAVWRVLRVGALVRGQIRRCLERL